MPCDEGYCENYHSHNEDEEMNSRCPVCGDPVDYCQGHGEIGDPVGFEFMQLHDEGLHALCHPFSDCRRGV